jgi:hypothetical protein
LELTASTEALSFRYLHTQTKPHDFCTH